MGYEQRLIRQSVPISMAQSVKSLKRLLGLEMYTAIDRVLSQCGQRLGLEPQHLINQAWWHKYIINPQVLGRVREEDKEARDICHNIMNSTPPWNMGDHLF